jgi:hypothetical protein
MKEMVILSAVIVGEGKRVECKVRVVKTTLDGSGFPPAFSDYHIMDSDLTDRLPDGANYEIHLSNGEHIPVRRSSGHFLGRL